MKIIFMILLNILKFYHFIDYYEPPQDKIIKGFSGKRKETNKTCKQ